jgi:hypothetical protein
MTRPSLFTLQGVALTVDRPHPAIGINERWHGRPPGQSREGHTRWAIATGEGLIGALDVVVVVVVPRDLLHLAQIPGPMFVQTLTPERTVKSFHEGVLIWPPGWADVHLDAQALPEAHKRTGEVAPAGRANKPGVAVKAGHIGQTVLAQRLHDGRKHRLGSIVCTWLDRQRHRRAHIDAVKGFDDMLLLAFWVGSYRTGIGCQSSCQ